MDQSGKNRGWTNISPFRQITIDPPSDSPSAFPGKVIGVLNSEIWAGVGGFFARISTPSLLEDSLPFLIGYISASSSYQRAPSPSSLSPSVSSSWSYSRSPRVRSPPPSPSLSFSRERGASPLPFESITLGSRSNKLPDSLPSSPSSTDQDDSNHTGIKRSFSITSAILVWKNLDIGKFIEGESDGETEVWVANKAGEVLILDTHGKCLETIGVDDQISVMQRVGEEVPISPSSVFSSRSNLSFFCFPLRFGVEEFRAPYIAYRSAHALLKHSLFLTTLLSLYSKLQLLEFILILSKTSCTFTLLVWTHPY